jgi:subtilisin family serine protease
MTVPHLATPWAPRSGVYTIPGSFIMKLALGEAPDGGVPSSIEVRHGVSEPATRIDGGAIDRVIRDHAGPARLTRVHAAAATALGRRGARRDAFDDVEHATGMSRTFRVDVDRGSSIANVVDAVRQLSTVEHAYPQYVCTACDAASEPIDVAAGWEARDLVYGSEAMAYEPGDAAVIVAVVDSGVAVHHPELDDRLRAGFDTVQLRTGDFAAGVTLLGDRKHTDTRPIDHFVGHGMGCAGIIGAAGLGMPPGLAGCAPLLPLRVLGAARLPGRKDPIGIGAIADIDCGMKMAVDLGAKVLSMSFGTADAALESHAPKPHHDVVTYALARGCVLVAASGNSGADEVYWPAAYEGVIAVGAVGGTGQVSSFSTRGRHVALCAPGEHVLTAALEGYQLATGTSFAAPFVTAAAALLVSRAARRSYPLDGARVREVLVASATPFAAAAPNGCGSGILNVHAALQALDQAIDDRTTESQIDE